MTHHWGYLGATTASLLFGISVTLNKIVLQDIHPLLVAGLIYFVAGILLLIIRCSPLRLQILALLETPTKTETTMTMKDYKVLIVAILSGSFLAPFLFMYGLDRTTAVNTSLLLNAESLFTVLIAITFLKERGMKKDYFGMILILVGALVVTSSGEFIKVESTRGFLGSVFVLAACLFWGIDNNLCRFLSKKHDLLLVTALKCSLGGLLLLLISIAMGVPILLPLKIVPYVFTIGALSIGFSILLFLFALREIGVMKTGVIFSTSSLVGAIVAFIVLDEPFTIIQMVAGVIMLYGIYLLYKK